MQTPYSVPPIVVAGEKLVHVPVVHPVFAVLLQIFLHTVLVPVFTHVRPAAHATVAEHVALAAAVPFGRQSEMSCIVPMNVAVNRSHVQFVGHVVVLFVVDGSQLLEHTIAFGIGMLLPSVSCTTH